MKVDKKILGEIAIELSKRDNTDAVEKEFFGGNMIDENPEALREWSKKMDEPKTVNTINSSNVTEASSSKSGEDKSERKAA